MTAVVQPIKERPILFSGPMVRAILEGRKTQTRRVIKYPPYEPTDEGLGVHIFTHNIQSPYGNTGDRLWVRETWNTWGPPERQIIDYAATTPDAAELKWRPSIFMPRWASRITLEIIQVRVERLNQISDQNALAEGIPIEPDRIATQYEGKQVEQFRKLWDKINSKTYPWSSNPWVWVVEFRKLANGDEG